MLAPAALAAMTSDATAAAVTVAVTWPEASVSVDPAAMPLPFCEVSVIVMFGIGVPAESFRANVSVVVAPAARELLPLIVMAVPVTPTVLVIVAPSVVVTVTVIVRFDLFEPRFSVAVTVPFASVVPPALMLLTNADGSVPVENATEVPEMAWPLASSATAVKATVVWPDEGSCGLLTRS